MDVYQIESNSIKEEPFDIEIKDESCVENETQAKYEEKEDKPPQDYKKSFQCTKCDFNCNSDTTIKIHNYCHGTPANSLLLNSKRKTESSDTPIFVKRHDYDPSKYSRHSSSDSDTDNKCDSDASSLEKCDNNDDDDTDDDVMDGAEFNSSAINKTSKLCFVCSICGFTKARWMDIKLHTKKHEYSESKYRCKECHFKTDIDSAFEMHKTVHKMEVNLTFNKLIPSELIQVPIKCSECEYTSSSEYRMVQHMMKHSSENNTTSSLCYLKKHMLINTGKKTFKCKHIGCNYASTFQDNFNRHMRTHSHNKLFKCKHIGCNYAAKSPNFLEFHMRSHTGKKIIACGECEFKSTQLIQLNIHMKECHSDQMVDNVFTHQDNSCNCTQCIAGFDSHEDLVMHLRDNKNNVEYKDDVRNDIQKHVKSHKNINLDDEQFECSLCDYISSSEKDIQKHSSICNYGFSDSYERSILSDRDFVPINNNTNYSM